MRRVFLVLVLLPLALVALPPLWFAVFPDPAPSLPPAGRRVPVAPGVSVNVLERGAGPTAVLVHGLPGSGYDWEPLQAALAARGLRSLAYDRVGYARSDGRADDDFSLDANARDLLALLEHEDLRDATVVGWSYGGGTAIRAATLDASRFGRLVLVGSAGPLEEPPEPPALFAVLFSAPVTAWLAAVPPVSIGLQAALSAQAFSDQARPPWWAPRLRANFAAPHTRRTHREEGRSLDWNEADPSSVPIPVLVIHGDDDRLVPLAVGEELEHRAPDARLVVVENGSHMLPITHAPLLAERIAAFAAGQRAAATTGAPSR